MWAERRGGRWALFQVEFDLDNSAGLWISLGSGGGGGGTALLLCLIEAGQGIKEFLRPELLQTSLHHQSS